MGSSLSGWEVSNLLFTLEKCANHAAGHKLLSILLGKAEPSCRKKAFELHKANKGSDKKKHIAAH